ncbi:methionine aminopeptidase, type I [Chlamydia psittaci 09DC78]|uniref:methionyl aminopeptidase n=1 Tax=Chlamydia psittaci TaxID=83554 RepID=UPI000353802F|nr:methionyl aminopeptidase [Chlamydia psittaci]EPJ25717.1 methionine aminopeptidase, type I [Chlamydia psittaci 09DC77]EPJ27296.1 methionine aminopeptidase, type I [Chlamydia psittaci 09DC80]EPJ30814.1 methionine aminopeptidase, type I [Chlamydia psittaci 09DC78]EPL00777.1 methionine aminopeptidase, type I [Chlamydia psittaci 09DC79]
MKRNDPCWCGSKRKWKHCHAQSPQISWEQQKQYYASQYDIILKTPKQIEKIRYACQVTARILDALCKASKEGVTTEDLDQLSRQLHKEYDAIPAPLNYGSPPFPKTICTSLNEVICHGIPNNTPLKNGDIMNIDVSCIVDGYYGDCSEMVMIGEVSEIKKRVCQASLDCLNAAIAQLKPNLPLYEIGEAIEACADSYGFSVVDQFVGHGVGIKFHENPYVPHYRNRSAIPLAPGMIFTIEPMINVGKKEGIIDPKNHWEARTCDNQPSAQWEHTLLITETGYEILTLLEK